MRNLALLTALLFGVLFMRRFIMTKGPQMKMIDLIPPVPEETTPVAVQPKIMTPPPKTQIAAIKKIEKPTPVRKKTSRKQVRAIRKAPNVIQRPGFVPVDRQGNIYIQSISLDGEKAISHGDVLVGYKNVIMDLNRQGKAVVLPKPKLWKKGIVYFEIDADLSNREEVYKSVGYFNSLNIVKFVEGRADDYLYFKQGEQNCYSFAGRMGGEQEVSLAPNCGFKEINHELMHALGFMHEQSREDRDDYLKIIWGNIDKDYHAQFHKIPNDFLNVADTKFDFNSIMLYPPTAFAKTAGSYSMTKKDGKLFQTNKEGKLSPTDLKRLKLLYEEEIALRTDEDY